MFFRITGSNFFHDDIELRLVVVGVSTAKGSGMHVCYTTGQGIRIEFKVKVLIVKGVVFATAV